MVSSNYNKLAIKPVSKKKRAFQNLVAFGYEVSFDLMPLLKQASREGNSQMERTVQGLADTVFDTIEGLKNGTITPQIANAIFKGVSTNVNLARLAIQGQKFVNSDGTLPALKLGASR